MEYILPIIIFFVVPLLFAIVDIHLRRSLVQSLIWDQLNGKEDLYVAFMNASPEQLLYPLTAAQLHAIRACSCFERTTAEVKGIRPLDGLLSDYYFTVHYDIRGTLPSGEQFTIQEDAYLRVCFFHRRRTIHWIVGSREPF